MSIPVILKNWQFDVNRQVGSLSALPACNQNAMLALKESLRSFSRSPWTVWGSSDGTSFGNGDTIDYWNPGGVPTPAKLVWGTGAHSWIVLRQTGLGANAAICIDLNNASSYNCTVVFSPSAGFGTANGGTNGTASARPTATDEIVLLNGSTWGGYNGTYTWRHHIMQTTDGGCTRICMMREGASVGFWVFDTVKNAVAVWTVPTVAIVKGDSGTTGVASYANLSTAAGTWGKIGSDTCSFYMSYEGFGTAGLPPAWNQPDDDTGEWAIHPIGLVCGGSAANRHRGRKAEMCDLWWGPNYTNGGVTYPDDVSRRMLGFGNFIVPWDGSVPWIWT